MMHLCIPDKFHTNCTVCANCKEFKILGVILKKNKCAALFLCDDFFKSLRCRIYFVDTKDGTYLNPCPGRPMQKRLEMQYVMQYVACFIVVTNCFYQSFLLK